QYEYQQNMRNNASQTGHLQLASRANKTTLITPLGPQNPFREIREGEKTTKMQC
ncbi:hypothetical protein M569_12930, partial [Genlisea aurea]